MMVARARGVPDGKAGMVATVLLVGELDTAMAELLRVLERAARRRDDALPLLQPCPDDGLTAYPVETDVNTVRHDGPTLIAPV